MSLAQWRNPAHLRESESMQNPQAASKRGSEVGSHEVAVQLHNVLSLIIFNGNLIHICNKIFNSYSLLALADVLFIAF